MTEPTPDLESYPGWFPAKLPVWRRKWVQVTAASFLAFVFGVMIGGAEPSNADGTMSIAKAHSLADKAAASAKAEAEADVLKNPQVVAAIAAERDKTEAAVAAAKKQAAAAATAQAQQQIQQLRKEKQAALKAAAKAQAAADDAAAEAASQPQPLADTGSSGSSGTDPRYNTCAEANDNGYGPYTQGVDPEYDWYQDRDHDGRDCEP